MDAVCPKGRNALHAIAENYNMPVKFYRLLVNSGIDLSHRNLANYSPLDVLHNLVVKHDLLGVKEEMIDLLTQNGAKYSSYNPNKELMKNKKYFDKFSVLCLFLFLFFFFFCFFGFLFV